MRREINPKLFLAKAFEYYNNNIRFENWETEVKNGVNLETLKLLSSFNLPEINNYICCAELYKIQKGEYSDFKEFEIVAKYYDSPSSLSRKDLAGLSPKEILKIIELADKKILLKFKNVIEKCELDKKSQLKELEIILAKYIEKTKDVKAKEDEFDKQQKQQELIYFKKEDALVKNADPTNKDEAPRIVTDYIDFDSDLFEKAKLSIDSIDCNSVNYKAQVEKARKQYDSFTIKLKEGSDAKLPQKQSLFPNFLKLKIGELEIKIAELYHELEKIKNSQDVVISEMFLLDYIIRFKDIVENQLKDYELLCGTSRKRAYDSVNEIVLFQDKQKTKRTDIYGIGISELDAVNQKEEWFDIFDRISNVSDVDYSNMICDLLLASRGKARETLLSIVKSTLHDESKRFNIEEIIGNLSSRQSEIGDEPELLLRDLSIYVFDQYRALEKDLKRAKRELQDTSGNIFRYLGEPMEKIEEFTFNISGSRQSSTVSELNNIVELFRKGFSKLKVESAVAFTDWKNRKTVEFSPELHMGDFEESTPVVPKTMGFAFDSSYSANSRKIIPAKVVSLSNIDVKEGTE